jgi:hypothetical protein
MTNGLQPPEAAILVRMDSTGDHRRVREGGPQNRASLNNGGES